MKSKSFFHKENSIQMTYVKDTSYLSFYAQRGQNPNYHYTFKVHSIRAAYKLLNRFKGVRAAYFVVKWPDGRVLLNQKLQL